MAHAANYLPRDADAPLSGSVLRLDMPVTAKGPEIEASPGDRFCARGLSVGGGLERKIDQNWSIRGEYRYPRFQDVDVSNNFFWSSSQGATNFCLALNSYFTIRIFQPSSLHMQLTSSEARMQRLK